MELFQGGDNETRNDNKEENHEEINETETINNGDALYGNIEGQENIEILAEIDSLLQNKRKQHESVFIDKVASMFRDDLDSKVMTHKNIMQ